MQSYHLTQWVLFFFIYSFIRWVWECCFVSVRKRRWVNRGFMYGPMLPIYGFGALAVLNHYLTGGIVNTAIIVIVGACSYFAVLLILRDQFFLANVRSVLTRIRRRN